MPAYNVKIKVAGKWILGKASNGVTLLNEATKNKVLRSAQKRHVPAYAVPAVDPKETKEDIVRKALMENLDWAVAHEPQIHYPPGDIRTQGMPRNKNLPQQIDCSQFATWMDFLSGAQDPNGGNYRAGETMYTGSLLTNSKHISASQVKPGDKIVYGSGTGVHVVTVRQLLSNGDFMTVSHGQERGPVLVKHSAEVAYHAKNGHGSVTFLQLKA